jgi:hypothetical protein
MTHFSHEGVQDVSLVLEEISQQGFSILNKFFSPQQLSLFEESILSLFFMQAQKIGEYRDRSIEIEKSNLANSEKLSRVCEMMEKDDKEALYQIQKYISYSPLAKSLFNDAFIELMSNVLGSNKNRVLIDGPSLFLNRPNTERLLYKWHSEAHYYPKRRRFLNVWIPLFDAKTKSNGTMSFKKCSHLRDFPFSDYQGYAKNSEGKSNYFIQYEIPSNLLSSYDEYWCEVDPGDLIIFHKNLAHTSNINKSNKYSFAIVGRLWDPTDDLTLSGEMQAKPYGGNVGRSNLVVDIDK